MMGGTLPILTACLVKQDARFGRSLSGLYGWNTLGAVAGVLLSGFVTIGWFGEQGTVYLGVAGNLVVALTAYWVYRGDLRTDLLRGGPPAQAPTAEKTGVSYSARTRRAVLAVFAASGFTALAYEVIWTRQLILFLETSVYAFSGMLAVFLCGIALGSMALRGRLDRLASPLNLFALLELGVGLLSVLNLYLYQPLDDVPAAGVLATVLLVFPMTFLFGMIFPLTALCYTQDPAKTGSSVGSLYCANTVGSILGSLLTGFWLVPYLGSTHTIIVLASVNVGLGLLLLALERGATAMPRLAAAPMVLVFVTAAVVAFGSDPFLAAVEKRAMKGPQGQPQSRNCTVYYNKEGLEGTITAFSRKDGKKLWINGMGMTGLCIETKLMAHLPLMYAEEPQEFLVICFGMGTTFRSAALYPNLKVTAVELVPEVFDTFRYYHSDAEQVKNKPNVRLIVDDGRNTLLFSNKKYDVISVDPAPPTWSAGTVNLYSREFFVLCKSRLTRGGVMCLWFPHTEKDTEFALVRTFREVFENATAWKSPRRVGIYLIAPMRVVPKEELAAKMRRAFAQPEIRADLLEYDKTCATPEQLQRLFWLDSDVIRTYAATGALITDNDPYTEFTLGRRLRRYLQTFR
jgi:spermidine synthase